MPNFVDRIGRGATGIDAATQNAVPGAERAAAPARSFASALSETGAPGAVPHEVAEQVRGAVRDLARGAADVDRIVRQAMAGRDFSPQELIAIQAKVYRYTQELDLVSKMVDKAIGAVKQTMQSQG